MKRISITSATVLLISLSAFAQNGTDSKKWYLSEYTPGPSSNSDIRFEVHGKYSRPVKQVTLSEARFLRDFIPGYPVNWITNYVSTEILATCNGKAMKAVSTEGILNTEQKNILNTADLATDIIVNVKYVYMNPATNYMEDHRMHVSMTVIPDMEAQYIGGYSKMAKFLQGTIIDKIIDQAPKEHQQAVVLFTVDEQGGIVNAKISQTSGDAKTDKSLLKAITNMPKWKPAENAKGIKVKQEFVFNVGGGGC